MKIAPKPMPGQEISLDNLLKSPEGSQTSPKHSNPPETIIRHEGNGWILSPIALRGKWYTYQLREGLLDEWHPKRIEEWIDYSAKAYQRSTYVVAAGDVLFSIMDFFVKHYTEPQHNMALAVLTSHICRPIEIAPSHKIITLTECIHQVTPNRDLVTQDKGLPSAYLSHGNLTGDDGYIFYIPNGDEYCKLILGCQDANHVSQVLKTFSKGTPGAQRIPFLNLQQATTYLTIGIEDGQITLDTKNESGAGVYNAIGVRQVECLGEVQE